MTYCATEDLRTALELLERAQDFAWRVYDLCDGDDEHAAKWLEDYKASKGDA